MTIKQFEERFYEGKSRKVALHNFVDEYITESRLSTSVYNCLRRGGIITIEDLLNASVRDLARIRYVDEKKLQLIIELQNVIEQQLNY